MTLVLVALVPSLRCGTLIRGSASNVTGYNRVKLTVQSLGGASEERFEAERRHET